MAMVVMQVAGFLIAFVGVFFMLCGLIGSWEKDRDANSMSFVGIVLIFCGLLLTI